MKNLFSSLALAAALGSLLFTPQPLLAQGTAFTYQGRLQNNGSPANGQYDFTFALFNNNSTNTGQVGSTLTDTNVGVTNGLFTVTLDFGSVFTGNATWLAIGVRTNGSSSFTALNSLQPLTPTPYAIYAPNAAAATNFGGSLAGDVTGTQGMTVVSTVGGVSAAHVASGANLANAATNANTAGTIVKRDALGNFSTGVITNTGLYVSSGVITPSVGNTPGGAGLFWPTNPGGGSGDEAWIRYFVRSGESCTLQMGILNDFDDMLSFYQFGAERMVIYNGNVGIGTTIPDSLLTVNGTADKPGGGSWTTLSDGRLKDVGADFTHGMEALEALQPIHYHYKSDNPLNLPSQPDYIGVVAQQVQEVIPEAVQENKNGYLTVNNDPIIWTMVNAIKELNQKNEAEAKEKDAEIDALKARLIELETTVKALATRK